MILQGTGDNFGCGCGAIINQYHHRHIAGNIFSCGGKFHTDIFQPTLGVNDQALTDESIDDTDRCLQDATGIVTQIQYEAVKLAMFFE